MERSAIVQIARDSEELVGLAEAEILQRAERSVRRTGRFTIALAGGSTPLGLYTHLARDRGAILERRVSWASCHFFWSDERHVPPDHPDSNFRMVWQSMLSSVPVPRENIHRVRTELEAREAAEEYEGQLRHFFRLADDQAPRFDLILLGMGADGHTASLFPGDRILTESRRLVAAVRVEERAGDRITLCPRVLNNSEAVVFLVSGPEKAATLKKVLRGDYKPDELPAQAVCPITGELLWIVDEQAARLLHP